MESSLKICIASDSLLIGEALCKQIEISNKTDINLFFYERELLNFVKRNRNALVVFFSRLKDVATHEILEKIKFLGYQIKIVLIDSNIARLKYLVSTQNDICKGALFHDIGAGELMHCLSEVINSRDYISSHIRFFNQSEGYELLLNLVGSLSPREKEIFDMIGTGLSTSQVASSLYISPTTINNHKTSLCFKLGIPRKDLYSIAVKYKEYANQIFNY